MARLARFVIPGQPQHIIQRGNNRQPIFGRDQDFQVFREILVGAADHHGLVVHAYVWMTNHIHLLATPRFSHSISKSLQSLGRKYVHYFNRAYGRTGTLWEGRYRATIIDSEAYLLTVMRYIELNPVRASMVEGPADYPWSSYRRNALGEMGDDLDWIHPHDQYLQLGASPEDRRAAYKALFNTAIPTTDLEAVRSATNRAWALGNERFCRRIEALAGRRAVSKGTGRPKSAQQQSSCTEIESDPV